MGGTFDKLHLVRFQSNKVRILYLKAAVEAPLWRIQWCRLPLKPVWWNGQPAVSPSTQDKAFYFPTIGKGKPAQKSENKRDIPGTVFDFNRADKHHSYPRKVGFGRVFVPLDWVLRFPQEAFVARRPPGLGAKLSLGKRKLNLEATKPFQNPLFPRREIPMEKKR